MNEPLEMTVERSAVQSAQALLLARIFASVLTLFFVMLAMFLSPIAARFVAMFAELGAELPTLSAMVARHGSGISTAVLILAAITFFFIWSKGKAAAWMAGLGLFIMTIFVPVMVFSLFLPLVKIISEMGNV